MQEIDHLLYYFYKFYVYLKLLKFYNLVIIYQLDNQCPKSKAQNTIIVIQNPCNAIKNITAKIFTILFFYFNTISANKMGKFTNKNTKIEQKTLFIKDYPYIKI